MTASFAATWYETGEWKLPSRLFPPPQLGSWLNLLTGPVLTIFAFVILPFMICVAPGHKLKPLRFLAPLLAVWPNILGGPLEEEFGWRGYLVPRLSKSLGNSWATLSVGVLWASWHLPIMLTHVWGISFRYFLPMAMAAAVFASCAYFATGGSILGPILVHYVFNTCSTMLGAAFEGQPRYGNRDVDQIVLICMVGVALLVIAVTRGSMGDSRRPARQQPPSLTE